MNAANPERVTSRQPAALMPPALIVQDGMAMADSRDVAAFFGKTHGHVLRDIDALTASGDPDLDRFVFQELSGFNAGANRDTRRFLMDREAFSILVMGFTGKRALKFKIAYALAFREMETRLRTQADQDRESPFAAPVAAIGVSEDILNQKMRLQCMWLRDKVLIPTVHEAVRDLERRLSAKIDAIAGVGGEDKTISDVVWHTANYTVKRLGGRAGRATPIQDVAEADLFTSAQASPATNFLTATEVCWSVIGKDQMHPRVPTRIARALTDYARTHCWPQGATQQRTVGGRLSPTFPADRVASWLDEAGRLQIIAENDRLHGRTLNVVALRA